MNVLKFKLSGKTAFFKKPDVNCEIYFTYTNIHKVALLGIFGAILGYGGYNSHKLKMSLDKNYKQNYPDFYEKLKDLKIAIEPINNKGLNSKKIQVFNNSVGYASDEKGGNLIVKQQWLENVIWNIYVLLDNEEAVKLSEYILDNKVVFKPYLGSNDHFANISEAEIIKDVTRLEDVDFIKSLVVKECVSFDFELFDGENPFMYKEYLPVSLNEQTNLYEFKNFVFTNMMVDEIDCDFIYNIKNKNIMFF